MLRIYDEWLLTSCRLALHEPTGTAIVADLHLGYSAARRAGGDAIPLPTVDTTLAPLGHAARQLAIRRLVVAGDLFEAGFQPELYERFVALLREWRIEWVGLTPGNHDRGLPSLASVPLWPDGYTLGAWHVSHGVDEPTVGKAVVGHWHPCLRLRGRKYPCFLVGAESIVLPAFSADAAGTDVRKETRWRDCRRVVIVGTELIDA
jgi:uncharacterized protein